MKQTDPLKFFSKWKWIDGRPLPDVIEPYRAIIHREGLFSLDYDGGRNTTSRSPAQPKHCCWTGRAKKNWKTADLILAALYRLLAWKSPGGNQC